MARNVNTSLDLLRSSLGNISTALTGKGVSGTNKLSEVASRIRGIEVKNTGTLIINATLNNRNTQYLYYWRFEVDGENNYYKLIEKTTPANTKETQTIIFEDVPAGSIKFSVRRRPSNTVSWTYIYDHVPETIAKNEVKTLNAICNGADPGNPEEPWFDGMMLEDSEVAVEIN